MMWSTNVENISSRRNSFGLGPHFFQQNKHIPLKKMIIRTTCKAVNCFSNVVNYSIVTSRYIYIYMYFYYVGKICTDIIPTNSCTNWEDYAKAWNYITIDFHQEMGQEYSKIVKIIVKADRRKAIAWRPVSCKMTCYHIPDEKPFRFSVCILYPLCSLYFVLTGIRGTNTVYFWLQLFAQHTQSTTKYLCELIWHFRSFPR